MITTARGGAATHVSAIAGAREIAMTTKRSGIVIQTAGRMIVRTPKTAETAGIRLLIESEVTGTETGVYRLEGAALKYFIIGLIM